MIPDPLLMADGDRFRIAERARLAHDVELPEMPYWNDQPCERCAPHGFDQPGPACRECGVLPRRHQRTGISWLYFTPRALLADGAGLGKTVQVAGLLALLKANGTLGTCTGQCRALVVCRAATISQWQRELARMVPALGVTALTGDRRQRGRKLAAPWEVALCGPEVLVSKVSRGAEQFEGFSLGTVVIDDVEAVRNVNKTSRVLGSLCQGADRVVVCTATPLDKRLTQLYDLGATFLGWEAVLGEREEFQAYFTLREKVWYMPKLKPTRCRWCKVTLVADYRRHLWVDPGRKPGPCPASHPQHFPWSRMVPEPKFQWVERGVEPGLLGLFRERIAPYVLRRTPDDADDMSMPSAELSQVWLELGKQQAERYEEIRKGVLTRLDERGRKVTRQEADALWMRAWQVTSGLACLDKKTSGESVKLDWATEALTGDMAGEPAVVYCHFRATLEDLAGRLDKAGVSSARIWGEQDPADREDAIAAFSEGSARVMLVTDAGGMGLNLQKARRLIMVDTPRSAGRVQQLVGRVRRDGSAHQAVYVTQLLTTTPLEQALSEMIGREAVMSASVLDGGQLGDEFAWAQGQDAPEQLLRMVAG